MPSEAMRASLLALSLLSLSAASAQTSPYRPLTVGNTWTYAVTSASSASPVPTLNGYLRVVASRDTVVGGRGARVMSCERVSLNGTPGLQGMAVAFLMPGATIRLSGVSECSRVYDGPGPYPPARISNPLDIGGTLYPMASVLGASYPVGPGGSHGQSDYSFDYGDPVGMARFAIYTTFLSGGNNGWTESTWTLRYAVVDGQTYGANPVAGEAEPDAATGGIRVYPVPSRSAVTVEVAEAASVEVLDALGRRVATGEAAAGRPLRLDVSAWPAGVYVARTDAGESVRIVVAR